jgi:Rieske 2Fe-2S family protein
MSDLLTKLPPRTRGFSLPRAYYTSPEVYELDMQKVFFTQWLYVGHESQIPKPGDYLTYETAGESILVARGTDGSLHAFFNVCRHRGARIVSNCSGHVSGFRCPYHSWLYGLDGSLKTAPGMKEQLGRQDHSLRPVHVTAWHGLVYINLSDREPADLHQMLRVPSEGMARFHLERTKIARTIEYEVPANWKLFMENYREGYHVKTAHPEFSRTLPMDGVNENRRNPGTRYTQPNYTFSHYPLREGARSQSVDGDPVSRPLGEWSASEAAMMHALNFYPAHAFSFTGDYGMVMAVRPRSATETALMVHWYVHADAVEGRDYDPDKLVSFWDITHRQDIELCRINQQGVGSRRYAPGPYSASEEDDIEHLLDFYINTISAA